MTLLPEVEEIIMGDNGDHLHEMSYPVFWENKKNISGLSSAEIDRRVVKVGRVLGY